jgi:hypothetical protein
VDDDAIRGVENIWWIDHQCFDCRDRGLDERATVWRQNGLPAFVVEYDYSLQQLPADGVGGTGVALEIPGWMGEVWPMMIVVVVVVVVVVMMSMMMMMTTTTTTMNIMSVNASSGQRMNSEGKGHTRGLHRPQKRQATNET